MENIFEAKHFNLIKSCDCDIEEIKIGVNNNKVLFVYVLSSIVISDTIDIIERITQSKLSSISVESERKIQLMFRIYD